jgi:hypothetical protein
MIQRNNRKCAENSVVDYCRVMNRGSSVGIATKLRVEGAAVAQSV